MNQSLRKTRGMIPGFRQGKQRLNLLRVTEASGRAAHPATFKRMNGNRSPCVRLKGPHKGLFPWGSPLRNFYLPSVEPALSLHESNQNRQGEAPCLFAFYKGGILRLSSPLPAGKRVSSPSPVKPDPPSGISSNSPSTATPGTPIAAAPQIRPPPPCSTG